MTSGDWELNVFFWLVEVSAWAALSAFAFRLGLIRKYPLVFAYVLIAIFFEILMLAAASWLPPSSREYVFLFVALSLITAGLVATVLLKIYRIYGPLWVRSSWHLPVAAIIIAALAVWDSEGMWIYARLVSIVYGFLAYLGLAATVRMVFRRDVDLGWNLKMVLLALTLPASMYALVFVSFTAKAQISHETASLWMRCAGLASWIILAVGMTEFSPPRRLGESATPGFDSHDDSKRQTKEIVVQNGVESFNDCVTPGGFPVRNRPLSYRRLVLGVDDRAAPRSADSRTG